MEILFLKPVYKDYLWGGSRLKEELKKDTPYEITAESWEVSTNKNGKSTIRNGAFQGMDLQQVFEKIELREELFGTKSVAMQKFPLLIKFIDAKQNLSVQVHPDDTYAKKYENDSGKTEMWYIMECGKKAKLICGLKDEVTNEQLENIIKKGKIKENLNYLPIEKGDSIYIPSGTVHAILSDILICEIQQNSDLTYRVYDWDRVDKNGKARELHINKALDVIQLHNNVPKIKSNHRQYQSLVKSPYFKVDKIKVEGKYLDRSDPETFYAINMVEGNGKIQGNKQEYQIHKGDSFIIPAKLGEYKMTGEITFLKSYL